MTRFLMEGLEVVVSAVIVASTLGLVMRFISSRGGQPRRLIVLRVDAPRDHTQPAASSAHERELVGTPRA